MEVIISSLHIETSDDVKQYAEDKFGKVDRFYNGLQRIEIVLKSEDRQNHCEAILHLRNHDPEVVDVASDSIHAAIDLAVDKVERLLRRMKERKNSHRRSAVR